MKRLKHPIKYFMLICIAVLSMSMTQKLYEKWDTDSEDIIYKEIATHKIVNEELINLIVEYDKMYAKYVSDSTLGITVYCDVSDKTIRYSVCYTANIGQKSPVLLCEPINGREVHISLSNMHNQIQLPLSRSVRLLKNSHPKQYKDYKRGQKEAEKDDLDVTHIIMATNSFVEWSITFDKFTGKYLRKKTPDVTKRYHNQLNK